ncbi:MAG TPA: tetraacyldisaccharide 4'-kinase [Chromobacteriaceae bacterium]|nr:tetraacyldisaccharide 4'-kinase [Chromobacteriaceae bacterium]
MTRLERHWYRPTLWLTALLAPLEGLFALISWVRRLAYRRGWCASVALPVPVVVVGNINVGGVGKTPLTVALLQALQARGVKVGVISRGYGGGHVRPTLVTPQSSAQLVGDEPLLLAAAGAPVVVGRNRVAAGQYLLQQHPDLQLLLTDDGLQHYRLRRDLELVVLDGARGLGNGHLLPAGPLREPASRLASVDAIVVNGKLAETLLTLPADVPRFDMTLQPGELYRLDDPAQRCTPAMLQGQQVVALAGIGHPERFFTTLQQLGVTLAATVALPDHHALTVADIPAEADAVIITAKDAVKLPPGNHARLWVLPVAAQLEPDLADWTLARLKIRHGR